MAVQMQGPPALIALIVLAVALHFGHSLLSTQRCSGFGRFQWLQRPLFHQVMHSTTTDLDVIVRQPVTNGTPHSAESRAKISAANKGKKPWNTGKQHSEETKRRIAEKTKEAMVRRKEAQALALGVTVEQLEAKKEAERVEKKRAKDATRVKGLTDDGRRRLSESLKKRWQDPTFRQAYMESAKGNRNHSTDTKARISEAIKQKWLDEEYRAKISRSSPSEEVRQRISQTLKARWEEPEFREKMMTRTYPRTEQWRTRVSEKIRAKWRDDPTYRTAVLVGMRSQNRTVSLHRVRRSETHARGVNERRAASEMRKKLQASEKARDRQRREMLKVAKALARSQKVSTGVGGVGGVGGLAGQGARKSIKELLGKEMWFEEKLRRRKSGSEAFMDDASLEEQLQQEWAEEEEMASAEGEGEGEGDSDDGDDEGLHDDFDDEEEEDDAPRSRGRSRGGGGDDEDGEGDDGDDGWEDLDLDLLGDEGMDVIEVYDEDGELVGTYTAAEFDKLKRSQSK